MPSESPASARTTSALRVAYIFPVGNIHAAPSVINSIECLARAGMSVDVFLLRNTVAREVRFADPRIRVILSPWSIGRAREPRVAMTLAFCVWLLFRRGWNYDLTFIAGLRSVIVAWVLGPFRRLRLVNLQLELYIGRKLETVGKRFIKAIERSVVGKSLFSIIQDERRAELLMADLGVPRDRIELVPNSPLGPGRCVRSGLLQRRLGLPAGSRLLLCPGTICEAMMASAIVRGAQDLPDGWVCVLHSSLAVDPEDEYLRSLRALNTRNRVVFSLDPVSYEELDELFGSAHVGLALYGEAGGQNTLEVGLASGKLIHFLKCGIPVVVSAVGNLGTYVEGRGLGVAIRDAAEIADAVRRVVQDYERMCGNAVRVFDEELAFDVCFRAVVDRMRRAQAASAASD